MHSIRRCEWQLDINYKELGRQNLRSINQDRHSEISSLIIQSLRRKKNSTWIGIRACFTLATADRPQITSSKHSINSHWRLLRQNNSTLLFRPHCFLCNFNPEPCDLELPCNPANYSTNHTIVHWIDFWTDSFTGCLLLLNSVFMRVVFTSNKMEGNVPKRGGTIWNCPIRKVYFCFRCKIFCYTVL